MSALPIDRERARLAVLRQYQILDTEPEAAFDNLVQLAALICGTPIACINFIDENRQWLKATVGWNFTELSRNIGICPTCIQQQEVLIVSDTLADSQWKTNPVVASPFCVRFYAGVPLLSPEGQAIATLCVMDREPRQLNSQQVAGLQALGRQVMAQLEMRRDVISLRQVEEQHQLAEARLRHLLSASPAVIYSCQPSGDFPATFISDNVSSILGYSSREFTENTNFWVEHIHPEDAPSVFANLATLFEQGHHIHEYRFQHQDGSYRWVRDEMTLVRDGFGEPLEIVGYWINISDRKQTEQALQDSEARLRLAMEVAGMGTWDWDLLTQQLSWSANLEQLFEMEPGTFDGRAETFVKLLHPQDRDRVLDATVRAIEEKEDSYLDLEFRFILPNGKTRWAAIKGHVICDRTGKPIQIAGIDLDITKRKQAELALRESERRYATLAQAVPVGIFRTDAQGSFVYVNERWREITGLSFQDALGEDWIVALHPDDQERVASGWYQWVNTVSLDATCLLPFQSEYRFQRDDGTIFWVFGQAVAERENGCKITGFIGTITDITERKQAEAGLQKSEERLQLVIDAINDAIWDWDIVYNNCFCSKRFYQFLGLPPKEEQRHFYEFLYQLVHLQDRERFAELLYQHLELNQPCQMEVRLRQTNGSYNWFLIRGKAIRDAKGRPLRMLGALSDISERKRAEDELKQQHQRSQLLAEITLKIRQSLRTEEILQTTVTEIQKLLHSDRVLIFQLGHDGSGTVVQEAVVPDCNSILTQKLFEPCFHQEYQEAYRQGRIHVVPNIATANLHPCHREFLENLSVKAHIVVPIILRDTLWGLLIAQQCLEPRDWSNFEIDLLQQLANQIGIALSQAQLLEQEMRQREELARSNTELEQFAYVASHDLQEPLRMVTSYLQLLERKYKNKLDSKADEFIAYAVDGASRMQILINDLLRFSRISTRAQPFETVDCNLILQQAIANLKVAIAESGAVITHTEALPQVIADATQLTQLFQNLINNAIKFKSELTPQIEIGVTRVEGIGTRGQGDRETRGKGEEFSHSPTPQIPEWLFWVRDNGIGIEPQYRDRIFVIFQRLHARGKYPGTGIGLAICKKIVERHGGRIWVESEAGQGATFYFTIPDRIGTSS
ncbi:PAS domain-containing protein [Chlorogloeopsis fritschii PCC 9212]|uniref:histidine kinase n=1 Tax=Chlorogloeopsis fritschii PCC 6912 TaxID=211165 RepID=A0A433MWH2_CHLFR|nr:PAS domain-containing protein [Chlorogloeopsis fritschii]RUR72330.1 hypothetical protein PCC6912_63700 [Chlorogloeopsis fritschii PCC 6912]